MSYSAIRNAEENRIRMYILDLLTRAVAGGYTRVLINLHKVAKQNDVQHTSIRSVKYVVRDTTSFTTVCKAVGVWQLSVVEQDVYALQQLLPVGTYEKAIEDGVAKAIKHGAIFVDGMSPDSVPEGTNNWSTLGLGRD